MWLRDTGTLERINNGIYRPPEIIPDPKVRRNQPLILRQLGIIMIVQIIGLLIGTVIFLIEVVKKEKAKSVSKADDGMKMEIPFNYRPALADEIIIEIIDN